MYLQPPCIFKIFNMALHFNNIRNGPRCLRRVKIYSLCIIFNICHTMFISWNKNKMLVSAIFFCLRTCETGCIVVALKIARLNILFMVDVKFSKNFSQLFCKLMQLVEYINVMNLSFEWNSRYTVGYVHIAIYQQQCGVWQHRRDPLLRVYWKYFLIKFVTAIGL